MPGFEIFFTDKVTWELDEGKAKMIYQWEESGILTWYPEKKEEKAVESEIEEEYQLQLMFTQDGAAGEQGMVSMIIADPVAKMVNPFMLSPWSPDPFTFFNSSCNLASCSPYSFNNFSISVLGLGEGGAVGC